MEVKGRSTGNTGDIANVVMELVGKNFDTAENYGAEPLPKEIVERGEILRTLVVKTKDYTVSLLTLYPGSAVKEHIHIGESEWYFDVENRTIKVCPNGDSHSLKNDTDDIIFVISVKYSEG